MHIYDPSHWREQSLLYHVRSTCTDAPVKHLKHLWHNYHIFHPVNRLTQIYLPNIPKLIGKLKSVRQSCIMLSNSLSSLYCYWTMKNCNASLAGSVVLPYWATQVLYLLHLSSLQAKHDISCCAGHLNTEVGDTEWLRMIMLACTGVNVWE